MIAKTLKARREQLGLTQKAVADAAEMARHYLADIEDGRREPSLDVLKRICSVLGLTIVLRPTRSKT